MLNALLEQGVSVELLSGLNPFSLPVKMHLNGYRQGAEILSGAAAVD